MKVGDLISLLHYMVELHDMAWDTEVRLPSGEPLMSVHLDKEAEGGEFYATLSEVPSD